MAFLTKDQYSRRNENAAKRMIDNAENTLLTEEQHEALAMLCKARHDLHSNKKQAISGEDEGLTQAIINANIAIHESGLITMEFVPLDTADYIDIDSMYTLDCLGEDYDYDSEYYRISNELEVLNSKIEAYLLDIDKKYNTNYAPTGAQRIF